MFTDLINRVLAARPLGSDVHPLTAAGPVDQAAVDFAASALGEALCLVSGSGRYLAASSSYATLVRRDRDSLANLPVEIVVGSANWNVTRPYVERAVAGEAVEVRLTCAIREGLGRDEFRVRFRPWSLADGQRASIVSISRQTAQIETQPLSHPSAGISELLTDTVVLLDRSRRYVYANPAFLALVGRKSTDVIGQPVESVIGEALTRSREAYFRRALSGETVTLEAADEFQGDRVWREIRYLPVKAQDGTVSHIYVIGRDIAAHMESALSLADERVRLGVLTDNLPAQITYLGTDLRYHYCNRRFLEANNLTEDQVLGRHPADIFDEATAHQIEESVAAARRGEHVQFERRSGSSGDPSHWWRVVVVADRSPDGRLRGTYGIAYDITEMHHVREQLAAQQQWFESFIENFPQPLCYFDITANYRLANRAYADLVERPKQDIVGRAAQDVLPWPVDEELRANFNRAIGGESFRTERAFTSAGRPTRWLAVQWLPDRDESGQVRGLYTLSQDISAAKQTQLAYEATVRQMQHAMDSVALPISFVDSSERVRFVNHTSTVWYGRHAGDLIGLPLRELMSEEDYRFARPYIAAALSGQQVQFEREMRYHDGIRRWVLIRYVPIREENAVTGFYTTATDIQSRKQQELALQQANWLLTMHLENTPLASFTLDSDLRVTRWSAQAEQLFGWGRDDVLERSFAELGILERDDVLSFFAPGEGTGPDSHGRRLAPAHCLNGANVACEWHIASLKDPRGRVTSFLALVQDVSQRVETENRLMEIAQRDTLTKLLNRHALDPTLRHFIDRARINGSGVAVLFLDLDHFKNINDTLGHRVGDLMLIEIARTLKRCVRKGDEVVRIGGDEFMVILAHERPKAVAHETAQRIIHALREPIRVENQRLSVAASVGVAVFPDHGDTPDQLLRSADLAMYKAKENGKNRFEFFSASLAQRSERRSAVKGALKVALGQGALMLYYQPRVDVASGEIVGAEALLRWDDPHLGPVSPKEFIGIAEESGLIHELGLFVFRRACHQLRDWQDRSIDVGVISVNFSAHQLLVATFVDEVDRVIEETGCDPRQIEVEITETSMLFDLGVTRNVIADLKHRGMHIAIDDFGTGFSSLSHLQLLDIDTLKIDQSFIRDMLDDAGDLAITRSVISLGRGLGLSVTAEGVENERQLQALKDVGCDQYQGFLYSPAIAPEDLEVLFVERAQKRAAVRS